MESASAPEANALAEMPSQGRSAEQRQPLLFDSDDEDVVVPSHNKRLRSRWRLRRHQQPPQRSISHWLRCRMLSRHLLWILKISAGFASGFIFALFLIPFWPTPIEDHFDDAFRHFKSSLGISPFAADYPTEFMKSVLPIPCHSHNDYWRQRPLWSALGSGCVSVEADVWHIGDDLYVGHTQDEVIRSKTLTSVYVDPLVEILDHRNMHRMEWADIKGVFYQDPMQTLVLLVDLKAPDAWSLLVQQVEPLRERGYLTHWDGASRIMRPVTVVASGSTPFEALTSNTTYRDIFFDAPLEALEDCPDGGEDCESGQATGDDRPYKYNPANSYYASSSLSRAIGTMPGFSLSNAQLDLIRHQVRAARERGLIPRYWGTPRWPRGLRDEVWGLLLREQVGILNVDDLRAARKGNWGIWPQP